MEGLTRRSLVNAGRKSTRCFLDQRRVWLTLGNSSGGYSHGGEHIDIERDSFRRENLYLPRIPQRMVKGELMVANKRTSSIGVFYCPTLLDAGVI